MHKHDYFPVCVPMDFLAMLVVANGKNQIGFMCYFFADNFLNKSAYLDY